MDEEQTVNPQPAEDLTPQQSTPDVATTEGTPIQPETQPQKKKVRRDPHWAIRVLLQLVSAFLCLLLATSLLTTALLIDTRILTSSGGINAIVTALTSRTSDSADSSEDPALAAPANPWFVSLSSSDSSVSSDVLTSSSALTDYLFDILADQLDDVDITKEQLQSFLEESTVTDYLSDKVGSYVDDVLSGTQDTEITVEEVMDLIYENQALIEETFAFTLTEERLDEIEGRLNTVIVENDLNSSIHETISEATNTSIGDTGVSVNDILQLIGTATSTGVIVVAAVICLILIGLILLCNFYRLPMGMCWSSYALAGTGALLSIPTALLQFAPDILVEYVPDLSSLAAVVSSLAGQFAPIHYGMVAVGIVLNIAGIVLNILWLVNRKRRKRAAAENS